MAGIFASKENKKRLKKFMCRKSNPRNNREKSTKLLSIML